MQTQRIINNSVFVFLGSLLGSLFGLMGTFTSGMGIAEGVFEKFQKHDKERKTVRNMLENIDKLNSEFGVWVHKSKTSKVTPFILDAGNNTEII